MSLVPVVRAVDHHYSHRGKVCIPSRLRDREMPPYQQRLPRILQAATIESDVSIGTRDRVSKWQESESSRTSRDMSWHWCRFLLRYVEGGAAGLIGLRSSRGSASVAG
ncbi:hypothetical protein M8818_007480 [Zalaria obscura]|uniref:Uncharacterized protein n=1 Tax=Zalaria obscura TaxID=2024903 RepID=A0ACC3S3X0_9PEZI